MGNQSSHETISHFSPDSLILDAVLNELFHGNVDNAVQRIRNLKIDNLQVYVDKIFDKAIKYHGVSAKYAELASKLCVVIPSSTGGHQVNWNLHDFICRKAQCYFVVLRNCNEDGLRLTNDRIFGIAKFIGNLYNYNLITSERILLWISHDSNPSFREVRKTILITIKDKVVNLSNNPVNVCDIPFICELMEFLFKEKILLPKIIPKQNDLLVFPALQQVSKPEQRSIQQQPVASTSSSVVSSSTTSNSNTPTHVFPTKAPVLIENIPAAFERHLKSLSTANVEAFDIQKFKTCTEIDKKQCASRLLTFALRDSSQAPKLAKIAHRILQLSVRTTANRKSVINYLSDECETKLKAFKNTDRLSWVQMESYGIFIGELYNLEVLKNKVIKNFLDNTKTMADTNDLALKILFKVMKLIYPTIRKKDRGFSQYLQYFDEYKRANRIPSAYITWYDSIRSNPPQIDRSRSLSLASQSSQASSSRSDLPSTSSTGAIKKQITPIPNNPITTELCDNFQKFLIDLQHHGSANISFNLDEANDIALRGCALLLVEQSIINTNQTMDLLVHITSNLILKRFKREDRKKIFVANLSFYIYAEIEKCLKPEKPASSNWKRAENIGKYISMLYNDSIVDRSMINSWLTKLEFIASMGSLEAFNIFQSTFVSVENKFKVDSPREYQEYQNKSGVKEVQEEIKPQNLTVQQTESQNTSESKISQVKELSLDQNFSNFDTLMSSLNSISYGQLIDQLKKLKVNDRVDLETITNIFYKKFLNHNGNPVYAQFALKMDEIIKVPSCSFKSSLKSMALNEFNLRVDKLVTKSEKAKVEIRAKLIGELYNIGWIDQPTLITCFDKLSHNNFKTIHHFHVFRNLLRIVSMKMAHNGHGTDCHKYYKILNDKLSNDYESFDYFSFEETKKTLSYTWNLSKLSNATNIVCDSFEAILKKLTDENLAISAYKFQLMNFENEPEFKEIINKFITYCINNPDNIQISVKFVKSLDDFEIKFITGYTTTFKHYLIIISIEKFLEMIANGFNLEKISKIIAFLQLQIELFNAKINSTNDLMTYLQRIVIHPICENKIDCIDYFVRAVGPKLDEESRYSLNENLSALKGINSSSDYVNLTIKNLLELRESNWIEDEETFVISFNDISTVERMLKDLAIENIPKKSKNFAQHVFKSEKTVNDFIFILFKCNFENSDMQAKCALLCKVITAGDELQMKKKFINNLNEFMKSRIASLVIKVNAVRSEKFLEKLENIILFNAELFAHKIIEEKTLHLWLTSTFTMHLSFSQISKICLLISPRVVESNNRDLKARLVSLESMLDDKFSETCNDLIDKFVQMQQNDSN